MKKDEIIKSIERIRMDMYDDVRQTNLWLDFMDVEGIDSKEMSKRYLV